MDKVVDQIHLPVLESEIVKILMPRPGDKFLDGTLGLGGHACALFRECAEIQICALDRDQEALDLAKTRLGAFKDRIHFFHLPFSRFQDALQDLGWQRINGAMLDLGLSSLQLDTGERGFSFRMKGPLDMRMDRVEHAKTAREIVNGASFAELKNIFAAFGEDPQAAKIAKKIIEAREKEEIKDTLALAEIIRSAYPPKWRQTAKNHPATRTFQALRMSVNSEIDELKNFLEHILPILANAGRLAIISFHSLEDRIVKNTMRVWAFPNRFCNMNASGSCQPKVRLLFKKPLSPSPEEVAVNPRARSAKLRACEKLGE